MNNQSLTLFHPASQRTVPGHGHITATATVTGYSFKQRSPSVTCAWQQWTDPAVTIYSPSPLNDTEQMRMLYSNIYIVNIRVKCAESVESRCDQIGEWFIKKANATMGK